MPTTHSVFTAHDREELKSVWGTQSTRLTRDHFLPFGACRLCLLQARDPVACESGHLFCRECAIDNLLAQKLAIKRAEARYERERADQREATTRDQDAERDRQVQNFEAVQAGLEGSRRGTKRKVRETESSFWVPSQTPSTATKSAKPLKKTPTCPSSGTAVHDFRLATLVGVRFSADAGDASGAEEKKCACPACGKMLSNSTRAVLAKPCGHVVCKACADKFLKPALPGDQEEGVVSCYVCQANVSERAAETKETRKEIKPGLVEISCEGTGFAGGGDNMVRKAGVVFQC